MHTDCAAPACLQGKAAHLDILPTFMLEGTSLFGAVTSILTAFSVLAVAFTVHFNILIIVSDSPVLSELLGSARLGSARL